MTTPSEAHERRIETERAHPIVDETMPGPPSPTTTDELELLGVELRNLDFPLTEAQRGEIATIIRDLRGDERRPQHIVQSVRKAPFPTGTVFFRDETFRRWYIEPDGDSTWTT